MLSKLFFGMSVLGLGAAAANAALVTVKLEAVPAGPVTPGTIVTINVYAKTDTIQTSPSQGWVDATGQPVAGGIRGFGFNITSNGVNGANYNSTGNTATAVFPAYIRSNFAFIAPSRTDVGADGDFDANGGSVSDTANFALTTLGTASSPTLIASGANAGFDLIASEKWTFTVTETLNLAIIGATYYDSAASGTNFQSNSPASASGVTVVVVPEPATLSMLGLGAMGLMARRRKA